MDGARRKGKCRHCSLERKNEERQKRGETKKRRHETRDRRRGMRGKILGGGKRERKKRMGEWRGRRQREKRE